MSKLLNDVVEDIEEEYICDNSYLSESESEVVTDLEYIANYAIDLDIPSYIIPQTGLENPHSVHSVSNSQTHEVFDENTVKKALDDKIGNNNHLNDHNDNDSLKSMDKWTSNHSSETINAKYIIKENLEKQYSSSESDSESDDSSSKESFTFHRKITECEQITMKTTTTSSRTMMDEDDNEDDEDDVPVGPLKTKHELEEEVIDECQDLSLSNEDELIVAGSILSCVTEKPTVYTILIQSEGVQSNGIQSMLQEGSVLCLGRYSIIGKIQEIFGPITSPYYVLRCNVSYLQSVLDRCQSTDPITLDGDNNRISCSNNHDHDNNNDDGNNKTKNQSQGIKSLEKGMRVYAIKRLSQMLTFDTLQHMRMRNKGSDASNAYDEEIPEEEQEYSDDEVEQAMKKSAKQKSKEIHNNSNNREHRNQHHSMMISTPKSNKISFFNNQSKGMAIKRQRTNDSIPQIGNISYPVPNIAQLSSSQGHPSISHPIIYDQNNFHPYSNPLPYPYHHQISPSYEQTHSTLILSQQLPWAGFGMGKERQFLSMQPYPTQNGQNSPMKLSYAHIAAPFIPPPPPPPSPSATTILSYPTQPTLPTYSHKPLPKKV